MGNDAKYRVLSLKIVPSEMPVQPVRVQFSSTAKIQGRKCPENTKKKIKLVFTLTRILIMCFEMP
jgi:hypothetical protein